MKAMHEAEPWDIIICQMMSHPSNISTILNFAQIIEAIMASTAKAEMESLYIKA